MDVAHENSPGNYFASEKYNRYGALFLLKRANKSFDVWLHLRDIFMDFRVCGYQQPHNTLLNDALIINLFMCMYLRMIKRIFFIFICGKDFLSNIYDLDFFSCGGEDVINLEIFVFSFFMLGETKNKSFICLICTQFNCF